MPRYWIQQNAQILRHNKSCSKDKSWLQYQNASANFPPTSRVGTYILVSIGFARAAVCITQSIPQVCCLAKPTCSSAKHKGGTTPHTIPILGAITLAKLTSKFQWNNSGNAFGFVPPLGKNEWRQRFVMEWVIAPRTATFRYGALWLWIVWILLQAPAGVIPWLRLTNPFIPSSLHFIDWRDTLVATHEPIHRLYSTIIPCVVFHWLMTPRDVFIDSWGRMW